MIKPKRRGATALTAIDGFDIGFGFQAVKPLRGRAQLDRPATVSCKEVDVVDLTNVANVQERMKRFRDSIESGERHLSEAGQPLVLRRLRQFFAWVGGAADDVSVVATL